MSQKEAMRVLVKGEGMVGICELWTHVITCHSADADLYGRKYSIDTEI
jgi:hypothetical protein